MLLESFTKTCLRCCEELPIGKFSKDKKKKDKLQIYCKECSAKAQKISCEKNKARKTIVTPLIKTCPRCKIEKPGVEFYKSKLTKDGLQVHCKSCGAVHQRKIRYGVSEDWYKSTLKNQGGGCAICGTETPSKRKGFHVDHDHVVFRVRGLLCKGCNQGLGLFKDSSSLLSRAKEYLIDSSLDNLQIKWFPKWGKGKVPETVKNSILVSQGFVCRICSVDLHTRACLDHCHESKLVRGYLCDNCNLGLGGFKDSLDTLTNAISYLEKNK